MTSAAPPTEFFPGIDFNASFYNLGQSAVTLDYLNSNFLRSTGYAISRAQYTLFNGSVDIKQNLDVSGNINASAYLLNGVPFTPSQWTTSVNDIYYDTGNVGIGKTNPSSAYKLDVSGNINADKIFRAGTELTQYTDTNVRTVLSNSAGSNMTWNTGTNKFDVAAPYTDTNTRTVLSNSAGSNMTWNTGTNKFDVAPSYTDTNVRTVLSNSAGSNVTWNTGTNKFDVTMTSYTLPIATNIILGGVKPDNTSISVNATTGIISLSGNDIILSNLANRSYGWGSTNSVLGRAAVAGGYSTGSIIGDIVLRSDGNLRLQSGTTNPALVINTSNQALINNSLGVATTSITSGFVLDVSGNVTMRNAVCIGSSSILSNYALDVTGNIITTGNIALANASRSVFWTGTNSNLARAGVAGEYSTSAAINDIVLRSGNKLILQSGVGAAGVVIDTANNIGIGISAPIASLDIVKTHNSGTTLDLLNMRFDNNWGLKFQQSYTGAGNIQYNLIHRYNAVDYNSLTFRGANVGIGNTAPIGPLTIGNNTLTGADGFIVLEKRTNIGQTQQWRIGMNDILDFGIGDYGTNNVPLAVFTPAFRIAYQAPPSSLTISSSGQVTCNSLAVGSISSDLSVGGTSYLRNAYIYSGNEGSSIALYFGTPFTGSPTGASKSAIIAQAISSWSRHNLCFCVNTAADNSTNASTNDSALTITWDGWINLNRVTRFCANTWNTCTNGNARVYYLGGGATYFRGNGTGPIVFRNGGDGTMGFFYDYGGLWIASTLTQNSDSRIKTNIKDIDDDEALNKILAIEPKTYQYIDKKTKGDITVYGFIAQQVKEVLPHAIKITSQTIPNIYKNCNCKGDIIYVSIPQDVEINTQITLIDISDTHLRYKILEISEDYIKIDKVLDVDNIFVYGYEIDDMHTMTKEYIYTLNVCATQILCRKIEEQKIKINDLESRLLALENRLKSQATL